MAYISFQPTDYFNTNLYAGTGSSLALTGVGFQPDFTWIKERTGGEGHNWTDSVRGVTKYIMGNNTNTQSTNAESLKTFDSDGFTLGTFGGMNTSSETYVAWNWKAGTTTGIAGSPSITPSSYSFNATSGFSIIAYTGTGSAATLPHGLGVAPKLIIIKNLVSGNNWELGHEYIGWTKKFKWNLTEAATTDTGAWNDVAPTSTLFTLGSNNSSNGSGSTMIAYCFAEVKGYSKIGSYVGSGDADGTFVYTGFRPAWIVLKIYDTTGDWYLFDNKREGYNVDNDALLNTTAVESTTDYIDILSNGFKLRSTLGVINGSANTMVYAAFAEFPIVSSNDIPGLAR